jgi:hypothetical protein
MLWLSARINLVNLAAALAIGMLPALKLLV